MRHLVKRNPILFFLWYHLYRKHAGVSITWFGKDTSLYLDGYPRCGNTFSIFLIRKIWPDLNVVHHFHAIAPVKIALKKNIPSFILIRNPLDAISSNYLKQLALKNDKFDMSLDLNLLDRLIVNYNNYYSFVKEKSNDLTVIQFTELITDPFHVFQLINAQLPSSKRKDQAELKSMINKNKDLNFGAKDKLGSSLPSKEKEGLKDIIKKNIISNKHFDTSQTLFKSFQNTA